ncbi:hypothetical protein FHS31_002348 [Sphingomonas vulcanisoli]|uniref:Uncharacterized protein n=1 Tax=Sphingomonas vulcanisoli TaxID=1658060 RepID=A0ABX0TWF1_9SPHN|nr:hypothetical protein [Sphingomonas vulcanisoli]NIJ08727.1 hypothetical protein [Sphingomonas vulcanisoli]
MKKGGPASLQLYNLNAAVRVTPSIHDANILGPFGWIVITVFLPAWLVSHIGIFTALLAKPRD